jgi:hypothetical protein
MPRDRVGNAASRARVGVAFGIVVAGDATAGARQPAIEGRSDLAVV